MGADAVINYRQHEGPAALSRALAEAAPDGVDLYFDNVGGDHLEAALNAMNPFGRVVCCGMIAQYNATQGPPGPTNLAYIVSKSLRLQGFIVTHHMDGFPTFLEQMVPWVRGRVEK